jgi:DNA-directed RNA polymerase specialized sigma24 family protein
MRQETESTLTEGSPDTHAQHNEAFAKIMPELLLIEKKVRKKITLLVKDPDASQDVWQEVLIKTWQHAEDLVTEDYGKEGREDWIYRVAHNEGINYAKARDASKRGGGRIVSLTSVESLKFLYEY